MLLCGMNFINLIRIRSIFGIEDQLILSYNPLLTMLRPAKGVYFKTGYDFEIGYKEIL